MKRIERAVAVVVSARGDMSFPESEEELNVLIEQMRPYSAVIVFKKDREYSYTGGEAKPKPRSTPLELP